MMKSCFVVLALCMAWGHAHATDAGTVPNSDGSYDVTRPVPPDPACPSTQSTMVEHHLPNGLKQTITTTNAHCGQTTAVQVLGTDGAVLAEQEFAGTRLISVEFINKGGNWQTEDMRFSPDQAAREIVIAGTPAQHTTIVCMHNDTLLLWKVSQSGIKGSTNVQDLHKILPPNEPVTYDEAQQVWNRLLASTVNTASAVSAGAAVQAKP